MNGFASSSGNRRGNGDDMKKRTARERATRSVKNLSTRTLTAKQAKGIKGGLFKSCATGKHIAKAVLYVR